MRELYEAKGRAKDKMWEGLENESQPVDRGYFDSDNDGQ